jgi:plasmid stabilization system protein ParE
MVIYSRTAESDLIDILYGLVTWEKHHVTFDHAQRYVFDIRDACDKLDKVYYHRNAIYPAHRRYGEKVYAYQRRKQTIWYIIYDIDLFGNILINKIMSNYLTK